jgi:hypothetical protein
MGRISNNVKKLNAALKEYETLPAVLEQKIREVKKANDESAKTMADAGRFLAEGKLTVEQFEKAMAAAEKDRGRKVGAAVAALERAQNGIRDARQLVRHYAIKVTDMVTAKSAELVTEGQAFKKAKEDAEAEWNKQLHGALEKAKEDYYRKKADDEGVPRKKVRETYEENVACEEKVRATHKKSAQLEARLRDIEAEHKAFVSLWKTNNPKLANYLNAARDAKNILGTDI